MYAPYEEQEIEELKEAIARVRELHSQNLKDEKFCNWCDLPNPCPTIQALDGEQ